MLRTYSRHFIWSLQKSSRNLNSEVTNKLKIFEIFKYRGKRSGKKHNLENHQSAVICHSRRRCKHGNIASADRQSHVTGVCNFPCDLEVSNPINRNISVLVNYLRRKEIKTEIREKCALVPVKRTLERYHGNRITAPALLITNPQSLTNKYEDLVECET